MPSTGDRVEWVKAGGDSFEAVPAGGGKYPDSPRKQRKPDVLVLNRHFVPISIVAWQKAMSLIFQESARPLDRDFASYDYKGWLEFSNTKTEDPYPKVSTVRYDIAVPEIISLQKYDRLPKQDVKYSRQNVFESAGFKCAYCGKTFERKKLTIDHIVPISKGGKTTFSNVVPACTHCNFHKADRTPEEAGMKLLFKPKKPKWISPLHRVSKLSHLKSWRVFLDRVDSGLDNQ